MKFVWIFIILSTLDTFLVYLIAQFFPSARSYLIKEDRMIENVSAILFLCSFLFGLAHLFGLKRGRGTKMIVLISIIGLLGFLEELSYGERIFDLSMPVISGIKIDALHDFFQLGYVVLMKQGNIIKILSCIIIISICFIIITLIKIYMKILCQDNVTIIKHYQSYILLLFCGVLIIFSQIIDLEIFHHSYFFWLEEVFEMNAALALLLSCIYAFKEDRYPNDANGQETREGQSEI